VFRFYLVSFVVADIRLAQTIFFYGSLCIMFVLVTLYIISTSVFSHGDASAPLVRAIGIPFTLIEPSFGWLIVILYQHNFMGKNFTIIFFVAFV
jgi:hypothetical protein